MTYLLIEPIFQATKLQIIASLNESIGVNIKNTPKHFKTHLHKTMLEETIKITFENFCV